MNSFDDASPRRRHGLEPARVAFAAVLRRSTLPWVIGLALALVASRASLATQAGPQAAGLAVLWLHLPGVLLALAAIAATLEAWPLFGRERDGGALLRRLCRTPLDGCGLATAGGVLASALLLAIAGATFAVVATTFAHLDAPRTFVRATAGATSARLDARTDRIELRADGTTVDALRLNPLVAWTRGPTLAPVTVRVALDGETLGECVVGGNGEQVLLPLATPRAVHRVELVRIGAPTLTLLFADDSVELRAARGHSLVLNLALASACYALPALLALLAAATLRRLLGLPALLTFAAATFVIVALAELAPEANALTASARGRFIAGEPLAFGPVAIASVALLAAAALLPWLAATRRADRRRTP